MLNRFFSLAATNNKAYVELLFWKNVGAVREMTEGYGKDGLVIFFICRINVKIGKDEFVSKIEKHAQITCWENDLVIILQLSEWKRCQLGRKKRSKNCLNSMKSTGTLKV